MKEIKKPKEITDREMYLSRDGCGNYGLHLIKPKFINRNKGFWSARKATWIDIMCPETKALFGLKRHLPRGKKGLKKIHLKIEVTDEES